MPVRAVSIVQVFEIPHYRSTVRMYVTSVHFLFSYVPFIIPIEHDCYYGQPHNEILGLIEETKKPWRNTTVSFRL